MQNEKQKLPSGPWDVPLREFVKTFPIMVTIYNLKNNEIVKEQQIDYSSYEDRKFLGRITHWAITAGHSVETMALSDYEAEKTKG